MFINLKKIKYRQNITRETSLSKTNIKAKIYINN